MRPGELLFAFGDDVYVVALPGRIRELYNLLGDKLAIRVHSGKTRTWNKAALCPPNLDDMGPDVWNEEGVKILGQSVHTRSFPKFPTPGWEGENRLWEAVSWVPDIQCAWQILFQRAGHHYS